MSKTSVRIQTSQLLKLADVFHIKFQRTMKKSRLQNDPKITCVSKLRNFNFRMQNTEISPHHFQQTRVTDSSYSSYFLYLNNEA